MAEAPHLPRRETRLLITTIALSVAMLLLLARFRFPEESAGAAADAPAAPLERLAARATYDELASIMADVERRIAARVDVLRIQPERTPGGYVAAPRLTADRAVILLRANEQVVAGASAEPPLVVGRDAARELAVVAVPARPQDVVTPRAGPPRPGPRYVAVVEATASGPAVRPVYVGRTDLLQDQRLNAPMLSIVAVQQTIPSGAALFALDGTFIGIASERGGAVTIAPAESLVTLAQASQQVPATPADLGVDVQALTAALARASGAERGVMVNYVEPRGPAAGVLAAGDVIQRIDGTGVTTVAGFQQIVTSRQPGKSVTIDAIREGKPLQLSVRAVEAGVLQAGDTGEDPGVVLRSAEGLGLEVVAIQPRSAAARADLAAGDIIVAVDGRATSNPAAFGQQYRSAARGAALLLTVRRATTHRMVALEKP